MENSNIKKYSAILGLKEGEVTYSAVKDAIGTKDTKGKKIWMLNEMLKNLIGIRKERIGEEKKDLWIDEEEQQDVEDLKEIEDTGDLEELGLDEEDDEGSMYVDNPGLSDKYIADRDDFIAHCKEVMEAAQKLLNDLIEKDCPEFEKNANDLWAELKDGSRSDKDVLAELAKLDKKIRDAVENCEAVYSEQIKLNKSFEKIGVISLLDKKIDAEKLESILSRIRDVRAKVSLRGALSEYVDEIEIKDRELNITLKDGKKPEDVRRFLKKYSKKLQGIDSNDSNTVAMIVSNDSNKFMTEELEGLIENYKKDIAEESVQAKKDVAKEFVQAKKDFCKNMQDYIEKLWDGLAKILEEQDNAKKLEHLKKSKKDLDRVSVGYDVALREYDSSFISRLSKENYSNEIKDFILKEVKQSSKSIQDSLAALRGQFANNIVLAKAKEVELISAVADNLKSILPESVDKIEIKDDQLRVTVKNKGKREKVRDFLINYSSGNLVDMSKIDSEPGVIKMAADSHDMYIGEFGDSKTKDIDKPMVKVLNDFIDGYENGYSEIVKLKSEIKKINDSKKEESDKLWEEQTKINYKPYDIKRLTSLEKFSKKLGGFIDKYHSDVKKYNLKIRKEVSKKDYSDDVEEGILKELEVELKESENSVLKTVIENRNHIDGTVKKEKKELEKRIIDFLGSKITGNLIVDKGELKIVNMVDKKSAKNIKSLFEVLLPNRKIKTKVDKGLYSVSIGKIDAELDKAIKSYQEQPMLLEFQSNTKAVKGWRDIISGSSPSRPQYLKDIDKKLSEYYNYNFANDKNDSLKEVKVLIETAFKDNPEMHKNYNEGIENLKGKVISELKNKNDYRKAGNFGDGMKGMFDKKEINRVR